MPAVFVWRQREMLKWLIYRGKQLCLGTIKIKRTEFIGKLVKVRAFLIELRMYPLRVILALPIQGKIPILLMVWQLPKCPLIHHIVIKLKRLERMATLKFSQVYCIISRKLFVQHQRVTLILVHQIC